jgi:hypothetical protein
MPHHRRSIDLAAGAVCVAQLMYDAIAAAGYKRGFRRHSGEVRETSLSPRALSTLSESEGIPRGIDL